MKSLVIFGILFLNMILVIPFVYALTNDEAADIILGNETNRLILQYCIRNPDGNITTDLVNTGQITDAYGGYTCDKAFEDNPRVAEAINNTKNITRF